MQSHWLWQRSTKFFARIRYTRYRVLRLYSRRTAANTLDFIDCVIEEMPFPIQRLQIDRGREFFAVKVQEKLGNVSNWLNMMYNARF